MFQQVVGKIRSDEAMKDSVCVNILNSVHLIVKKDIVQVTSIRMHLRDVKPKVCVLDFGRGQDEELSENDELSVRNTMDALNYSMGSALSKSVVISFHNENGLQLIESMLPDSVRSRVVKCYWLLPTQDSSFLNSKVQPFLMAFSTSALKKLPALQ